MMTQSLMIALFMILHPMKMYKILKHCHDTNHLYNMEVLNFRFDVWCDDCGEIVSDEIQ